MTHAWHIGVGVHVWLWLLGRAAERFGLRLRGRSWLLVRLGGRLILHIFVFSRSFGSPVAVGVVALASFTRARNVIDTF